jgi:S-adenosylmethionine hydrolase
MPRVVTLTTDFGAGSGYVAELKGRLLHARQALAVVDICHDLPPHDIRAASWLVGQSCFAFPPGTLHLVVVDPGVGTPRSIVWARLGDQEFLCPDNGLLTWPLRRATLVAARQLEVPINASATFHGRDVLAPAAVRLLEGESPDGLGTAVGSLVEIEWPAPQESSTGVAGEVLHVDAFGNLVTNLPASLWPRLVVAGGLRVGDHDVTTLVRTYGEAARGTIVALVGSQGFIEAAVVVGRAAERLGARVGTPVKIKECRVP